MRLVKYLLVIMVLLVILVLPGCAGEDQAVNGTYKNITVPEAFGLIEENANNPDFVIIDVRTPAEYAAGHIIDAINMDFYAATFKDDLAKLDKDITYFIYCRTGNRSGQVLKLMESLSFKEVFNLSPGGMPDWIAAGLPYVTIEN
ncbi:MAG: rhodanese-like domain-containing protein [Dehalococcoidales bacterium]|nr:rhodanese-like domain-containing protein [Dehalococcoidales bacterium]